MTKIITLPTTINEFTNKDTFIEHNVAIAKECENIICEVETKAVMLEDNEIFTLLENNDIKGMWKIPNESSFVGYRVAWKYVKTNIVKYISVVKTTEKMLGLTLTLKEFKDEN